MINAAAPQMTSLPYHSRVCSSPGTPKPSSVIHRITGTPRTMSVYSVAARRTGNSAGVRTLRAVAINRPSTMMHGAQKRKIFTSNKNGRSSLPKAWV